MDTYMPSNHKQIQNESLIRAITISTKMVKSIVEQLAWFFPMCAVTAALIALLERWLQPDLFRFASSLDRPIEFLPNDHLEKKNE